MLASVNLDSFILFWHFITAILYQLCWGSVCCFFFANLRTKPFKLDKLGFFSSLLLKNQTVLYLVQMPCFNMDILLLASYFFFYTRDVDKHLPLVSHVSTFFVFFSLLKCLDIVKVSLKFFCESSTVYCFRKLVVLVNLITIIIFK